MTIVTNSVQDAVLDAFVDTIDGGAGSGLLEIWTTGFGTLLATLTFADPAYAAASGGTAVVNPVAFTTAVATGTAAVLRVTTSTPTTLFEGTVGDTPFMGKPLVFNTVSFVAGDKVLLPSFTIT